MPTVEASKADGVALVVEAGPADMDCRRDGDKPFLFGVAVEPSDGAQPAGNGGPGTAAFFQGPGVQLDVGAAHREQPQAVALAPGNELAQVERVGVPGEAPVAGQEGGQGEAFGVAEHEVGDGADIWGYR